MSRVFVCGLGAVSPAGWGVVPLRAALAKGEPVATQPLKRPGGQTPLPARLVPPPASRLPFLAHPRLRRSSPITHYAASAALEAAARVRPDGDRSRRLGVVVCLQVGCVHFSYRFFDELLKDPATASPLLFPETVFAAPVSHIAAVLENTPVACTLTGDPACFLQGMSLAVQWLEDRRAEACVVIGAEEADWLLADAVWHFDHRAVVSAGAGAVCLSLDPALSLGVELDAITDPHTYTARASRAHAVRLMRQHLPPGSPAELLCDSLGESPRGNDPELAAWSDWAGSRLSVKRILGEGLMAAGAWQCVAACDAVASGRFAAATVSLAGGSQQAIGVRFAQAQSTAHLPPGAPSANISS